MAGGDRIADPQCLSEAGHFIENGLLTPIPGHRVKKLYRTNVGRKASLSSSGDKSGVICGRKTHTSLNRRRYSKPPKPPPGTLFHRNSETSYTILKLQPAETATD